MAGRRCIMVVLTGLAGFTRLLGLGHFVWFPRPPALLPWTRLGTMPASEPFGFSVRVLMVSNGASLVIESPMS